MPPSFPRRTRSQSTGDIGVGIAKLVFNQQLGWMFRQTPQEADFGVDGYVDIETDEGHVTGKSLAVQIKTGESYLKSTNDGANWIYVGDLKHINYYINHDNPVLLLVVDPKSNRIWWRRFSAYETERTKSGWTTEIPKVNLLTSSSKSDLRAIAGCAEDYLEHLESVWTIAETAKTHDLIILKISQTEVETGTVAIFGRAIRRLAATEETLRHAANKLDFVFDGYDDDPREVYQIPEIRNWVDLALRDIPHLTYFLYLGSEAQGIQTIVSCLGRAKKINDCIAEMTDPFALIEFMKQQFRAINVLTASRHIDDLNEPISLRLKDKIIGFLRGVRKRG